MLCASIIGVLASVVVGMNVPACPHISTFDVNWEQNELATVVNTTYTDCLCANQTEDTCGSAGCGAAQFGCVSSTYPTPTIYSLCQWLKPPTPNPYGYTGVCYPVCGAFANDGCPAGTCTSAPISDTGTNWQCAPAACTQLHAQTLYCSSDAWFYYEQICMAYLDVPYQKQCVNTTATTATATTTTTTTTTATQEALEQRQRTKKINTWRGVGIGFASLTGVLLIVGVSLAIRNYYIRPHLYTRTPY